MYNLASMNSFKISRPEHLAHIPDVFDLNQLDQKTGRVFRELIEDQFNERLPFVLAYEGGSNFVDGRSFDLFSYNDLEGQTSSTNNPTVVFFAVFPGQEELSYIGSTADTASPKFRVLDLFLQIAKHDTNRFSNLTSLATIYKYGEFTNEGVIKQKIRELQDFHLQYKHINGVRAEVDNNLVFINAMVLLRSNTAEEQKTGLKELEGLAYLFYKPSYFPIGFCYYYGRGTEINYTTSQQWIERALRAGDSRALDWSKKETFNFKDVILDFQHCINMQEDAHNKMNEKLFAHNNSQQLSLSDKTPGESSSSGQLRGQLSSLGNLNLKRRVQFADD